MPDIKVRVGQQNTVKVLASAYGGSLTAETATNVVGGIASVTQLSNTGVSTLGGPILAGSDLRVAGVSTFVGISTFGGDVYIGGDLYLKDDITLDDINANSLTISGITTLTGNVNLGGNVDRLAVTGVSTFNDVSTFNNADVVFQGAAAGQNMTWDASENDLEFTDSARLKFGNSDDLEIWHDAPNSHIKNSTNQLRIRGDEILLKTADDSEKYLEATKNQDVKLFYNGDEKFATISTGATVTGDLYVSGDLSLDDITLDHINGTTLNITGIATFASDVSIGGTLTYEDVTNVDSIGIVTAGKGFRATTGGLVVTAGISTFDADLQVASKIRHKGDTDTYIEFLDDHIELYAGGKGILTVQEATVDTVIVNDGSNNCDFRVEGLNDDHLIFSDGGTDTVGIGSAIPTAKLDVGGTANVSGTLTAGLIDGGLF